jgi:hypothetical protein
LGSEKRQKKTAQNAHKRKLIPMEAERDKQKAELEKSGVCITFLLLTFDSKKSL